MRHEFLAFTEILGFFSDQNWSKVPRGTNQIYKFLSGTKNLEIELVSIRLLFDPCAVSQGNSLLFFIKTQGGNFNKNAKLYMKKAAELLMIFVILPLVGWTL